MKVAIITPYFKESIDKISRCHHSVLNQTYRSTHFLVSDGFPNLELDEWNCEHIKLSRSHKDNGNTPRTIGAISALNQGFDAIAFLDADNWLDPHHIELVLNVQQQENCDVVFANRFIVLLDGYISPVEEMEDIRNNHVDTSCFVIFSSAAFLLPMWAMMPQYTSPMCDRIMFYLVKNHDLKYGWTNKKTVYFESLYSVHYQKANQPIPQDINDPDLKIILRKWSAEDFFKRMRVKLHVINFIRYFRGKN
jgi:glycosyltransferase involved in cell wall biosynthesis